MGPVRFINQYIDDIIEWIVRTLDSVAEPDSDWSGNQSSIASSSATYNIYNIGNHSLLFHRSYRKAFGQESYH
jgi:hypothetical protein